jgi:tetratricopeptide (TPR) repeat protein
VLRERSSLANELALFALKLGRLVEARVIRLLDEAWPELLVKPVETSIVLNNSSELAFALGHLIEAQAFADAAHAETEKTTENVVNSMSLGHRAAAAHGLGDIAAARADFAAVIDLMMGETLYPYLDWLHGRHLLDLGDPASARTLADRGLTTALRNYSNFQSPRFHALLARIDLAEGNNSTPHLEAIRSWTSRTGDMEWVVSAHLLAARHRLAQGDSQAALAEAECGLLHASSCGYGLLRIELLIALARIRLALPDAPGAIQAAREALDRASHPDCRYAWGEADAAQVWGEAFFSNHETTLAQRAFERALEVRRRIEHPGASETENWLQRLS